MHSGNWQNVNHDQHWYLQPNDADRLLKRWDGKQLEQKAPLSWRAQCVRFWHQSKAYMRLPITD